MKVTEVLKKKITKVNPEFCLNFRETKFLGGNNYCKYSHIYLDARYKNIERQEKRSRIDDKNYYFLYPNFNINIIKIIQFEIYLLTDN